MTQPSGNQRPRVTVEVRVMEDAEPLDIDQWMKLYVDLVMEVEGIDPLRIGPEDPPAKREG